MTANSTLKSSTTSRRQRLRAATHDVHERLDGRIRAFDPFTDRLRYAAFLRMEHRLLRDVEALYADPALNALLPGLSGRSRLALAEQDLRDLGAAPEAVLPPPAFAPGAPVDGPVALGWLYTVEGSNLGAAFLLKAAGRLGLHAGFGARHLAPHADGRGASWRGFTARFDALALPAEDEGRVDVGAQAAFATALAHAQRYLPVPA